MSGSKSHTLVVGVASSALFDLTESDAVFRSDGVEKYRDYQEAYVESPLQPGVAFSFVRRLLSLNDIANDERLVDVVILSRNSPKTGLRVLKSIESCQLPIHRAIFTEGKSPFNYVEPLGMSLFLSANEEDVLSAIKDGLPAGRVIPGEYEDDSNSELRIAFDFDGVLASDEAEAQFQLGGVKGFEDHEQEHRHRPLEVGPMGKLLASLNGIQKREDALKTHDPSYTPRLRIAMVTARGVPAIERAIRTLTTHELEVNDAFVLSGSPKKDILAILKPHVFFDDQTRHLENSPSPGVHVPYGVANNETTPE